MRFVYVRNLVFTCRNADLHAERACADRTAAERQFYLAERKIYSQFFEQFRAENQDFRAAFRLRARKQTREILAEHLRKDRAEIERRLLRLPVLFVR